MSIFCRYNTEAKFCFEIEFSPRLRCKLEAGSFFMFNCALLGSNVLTAVCLTGFQCTDCCLIQFSVSSLPNRPQHPNPARRTARPPQPSWQVLVPSFPSLFPLSFPSIPSSPLFSSHLFAFDNPAILQAVFASLFSVVPPSPVALAFCTPRRPPTSLPFLLFFLLFSFLFFRRAAPRLFPAADNDSDRNRWLTALLSQVAVFCRRLPQFL